MSNYMELPWNIEDTIENLKELRDGLKEKVILMNKDGRGEKDAEELDFDFNRAIDALEKQVKKKPVFHDNCGNRTVSSRCPKCFDLVSAPYCRYCGQALDWSD